MDFLTVTNSAFVDLENRGAQVQRESEKKQSGKKVLCRKKEILYPGVFPRQASRLVQNKSLSESR